MITNFGAFLLVSALVIVTPGQDTALTIRNSLIGGRRSGVATAVGVAGGQAVWTVAASAGLAALLQASEPAFDALRLAGAAYLVFLGLQALRGAVQPHRSKIAADGKRSARMTSAVALRQGLLSNLGNAKMAIFFTSLLPQFTTGGSGSFAALLALGLVFCVMTLTWLSAYAVAVAKAGDVLRRRIWIRRTVDAVTGAVLVVLGVRLATEPR